MTDPAIWTFLGMSALVIALAYISLRYAGRWQMRQSRSRRLRVVEALYVGRDRQILLVAVGKELLLLGSSPNGVSLVHQLPDETAAVMLAEADSASGPQPFSGIPPALSGTALETSIRNSLGKMRSLLGKESADQSDRWGPPNA